MIPVILGLAKAIFGHGAAKAAAHNTGKHSISQHNNLSKTEKEVLKETVKDEMEEKDKDNDQGDNKQ